MIGKTVAHYNVTDLLGVGGMGEVYRARDTKLGRDVALKFLPESFAADEERLARFEREAKVLASLNHSNIAAIYGIEQVDGKHFLVLELAFGLGREFAIDPGGSRFVWPKHLTLTDDVSQVGIILVENWALEFSR